MLVGLVGVLVATAGCSALGFGSSATTNVLLVNNDESSHDVTVEVLNDGNSVYSGDVTVDAETDEELPAFEESGEYVVAVDGETTEQTYEFTSDDDTVSIGVADDATVTVGG